MPSDCSALRRGVATCLALLAVLAVPAASQDTPARPDSPMVKMLKSGRVPPERQGTLIEMLGKRGTGDDLAYLLGRAVATDGFDPALRVKVLQALAEAMLTRKAMPAGNREDFTAQLGLLMGADRDRATRLAAIQLAGRWGLEGLVGRLGAIAADRASTEAERDAACQALGTIPGNAARMQLEKLAGGDGPFALRVRATAALVEVSRRHAVLHALRLFREAKPQDDLAPLLAALLNNQGASAAVAEALTAEELPADSAKLVLRAMYAVGRTEPNLVGVLSKQSGISAEVRPPTPAEVDALIAEVAAQGDPARGERVFRRAELNCLKCHAISGAGGGVGPDLSAIGGSSPVDYLIRSVMVPDEAIKEEYQTLVVQTVEGQVYQGIVADRDDQRLILKESTGDLRVIAADDVEDSKQGGSLMPKGLVNFMTRAEFVDLLRFLSELGKSGDYAIRSTQTIQRWRVLNPVPDKLAEGIPDEGILHEQVLGNANGQWSPAYGMVAGSLPLDELLTADGPKVLYLQGEVDVTTGGPVEIHLDSAEGVTAWVDDRPIELAGAKATISLEPGKHPLTLRVDPAVRTARTIRVELTRPAGASTDFIAVGGR